MSKWPQWLLMKELSFVGDNVEHCPIFIKLQGILSL